MRWTGPSRGPGFDSIVQSLVTIREICVHGFGFTAKSMHQARAGAVVYVKSMSILTPVQRLFPKYCFVGEWDWIGDVFLSWLSCCSRFAIRDQMQLAKPPACLLHTRFCDLPQVGSRV